MPNIYTKEDREQVELVRQRLLERERSDMRKTLNTPEGRRVIWRFLRKGSPFTTPFVSGDSHATALLIGKKEVALEMYAEIEATQPDLLMAMRREAASDKLLHEAELKGAENGK